MAPFGFQEPSNLKFLKWLQNGPMLPQDGFKVACDGSKMAPRRIQDDPRWPKMGPIWPKKGPGMLQDGPKKVPHSLFSPTPTTPGCPLWNYFGNRFGAHNKAFKGLVCPLTIFSSKGIDYQRSRSQPVVEKFNLSIISHPRKEEKHDQRTEDRSMH